MAIQRNKAWKSSGSPQQTTKEIGKGLLEMSLCWNCRQGGHMWRDCEQRKMIFCHICGHPDTTAYQCPQKHNLRIREKAEPKN